MWPDPATDPRPTPIRSSQLPTNPNSCRSGLWLTGVYQEDSPSKRTSDDSFPRLTQDNEIPTLTDGPSISAVPRS